MNIFGNKTIFQFLTHQVFNPLPKTQKIIILKLMIPYLTQKININIDEKQGSFV